MYFDKKMNLLLLLLFSVGRISPFFRRIGSYFEYIIVQQKETQFTMPTVNYNE
jgi:hypothetical protein